MKRAAIIAAASRGLLAGAHVEAGSLAVPTETPWYRRTWVGIEWGPTGANAKDLVYMSKASGTQIVEKLMEANAEYGVVFMKDQTFAYYNSRLAPTCPALEGRDLLQECIDAARPYGLPIVAYCQVQYDTSSWDAHPEWRMKGPDGKDLQSRLCYRSGYLEFITSILDEMMQYAIQGFHVDMLDFGFQAPYGCWCDRCRTEFEREYGAKMPSSPTWDETWDSMLDFRYASNLKFCRSIDTFIRETRSDVSVDYNYHGYPPFSWEAGQRPVSHANNGDFVTAEGLPFVFGHTNPGLLACFLAGARPQGPLQVATSRSIFNYHDFTVRPEADLKWEVMTYLAHGVQCTVVDKADYDGGLDKEVYRRLGAIFGEAREKREHWGHEVVQEVGVYYSQRSRDWFGREDNITYMMPIWGAHKALVQSHIPLGFVMDENVSLERLHQFPVIYLAGTAIVSDREVNLLHDYVSKGGNLLVSGVSGWCDAFGRTQHRSSLETLIGARFIGTPTEHMDNYLRFPPGDSAYAGLVDGVPTDWCMLTYGPIGVYEPETAQTFGEIHAAHRSRDNQWAHHMSAGEPRGPAVLVNSVGKGRVVCVAAAPDAAYAGRYRMPEHRCLIRNIVRFLNPNPLVRVCAPAHVESVVSRDGTCFRVHLLSFTGPPTSAAEPFAEGREVLPTLMEEAVAYEATIELKNGVRDAKALDRHTVVTRNDRAVRVRLKSVHETVIVDSAEQGSAT